MKKAFTLFISSLIAGSAMGQMGEKYGPKHEPRRPEHHQEREETSPEAFRNLRQIPAFPLKAAENLQVLDSLTEYRRDEAKSGWVEGYKSYYMYNGEGLIVEWSDRYWNSASGDWELDDMETYEYDANGNLILETAYELNESGTEWYSVWKRENYYEGNRLTGSLEYQKREQGESFYQVWRVDYMYDQQERVSGTIEYLFVFSWEESWKTEYTYDEKGNLIRYTSYNDSDSDPSGWIYTYREEFEYDENSHLTLYEAHDWDEDAGSWVNDDREEYQFSASGNVDSYIDYDWDESGEKWVMSWKGEYTYDDSFGYDQLVLPWFYHDDLPNFFNHMMTEYNTFDYEGGEWVEAYRGNHHFSGSGITGLTMEKPGRFAFYPNPAGSTITLLLDDRRTEYTLEVFDLSGKMMLTRQVRSHQPVDVGQLTEGMFLMRVWDPENNPAGIEKIFIRE